MNANPACYLRYKSRLRPKASKPITFKVLDVEVLKPNDIIVAVASPMAMPGFRGFKRRYMYLHLDRMNGMVWYYREGAELRFDSPDKCPLGTDGEFLTL